MDDEFKQLKERVIAETDAWLQRVARECGASFGDNNLETIERTLNAQRQRITGLEAENKGQQWRLDKLIPERDALVQSVRRERDDLRAQNAALVAAGAGGQAVTWEYDMQEYGSPSNFLECRHLRKNWQIQHWELLPHDRMIVMWQRPAESEDGTQE